MAGLLTLRVFARNLLRGIRRSNIFSYFVFLKMFDLGFEPRFHKLATRLRRHLLCALNCRFQFKVNSEP